VSGEISPALLEWADAKFKSLLDETVSKARMNIKAQ
jgi:hypothetical protein